MSLHLPRLPNGAVDVDQLTPYGRAAYEAGRLDEAIASHEDRAAAFLAGQQHEHAERLELAAEDRARQLLADLSRDMEALAIASAAHHGPEWQAEIRRASRSTGPRARFGRRGAAA